MNRNMEKTMNRAPGYPMPATGNFEWPDLSKIESLNNCGTKTSPKILQAFRTRLQIETDREAQSKGSYLKWAELSEGAKELAENGHCGFRLSNIEDIKKAFAPDIKILMDKTPVRTYRDYDRDKHYMNGPMRDLIHSSLSKAGVVQAAQEYFGLRGMKVDRVVLHVSYSDDTHYQQVMSDTKEFTKAINFHFDPKAGTAKCILYLKDIGVNDGPFTFITQSHRWLTNQASRLAAKANCTVNYLDNDVARATFMALPEKQRKDISVRFCHGRQHRTLRANSIS